jgi:hypothetical protein
MTDCTCALGTCKCKPIAGWIPNKGFKKDVKEDISRRGFLKGMGAAAVAGAAGGAMADPGLRDTDINQMIHSGLGPLSKSTELPLPILAPVVDALFAYLMCQAYPQLKENNKDLPTLTAYLQQFHKIFKQNDPDSSKFNEIMAAAQRVVAGLSAEIKRDPAMLDQIGPRIIHRMPMGIDNLKTATSQLMGPTKPSPEYTNKIRDTLNSLQGPQQQFQYPAGKPGTKFQLRMKPDGTIISREIITSSGNPEWDKWATAKISNLKSFPRDVDGRVPYAFNVVIQPELNESVSQGVAEDHEIQMADSELKSIYHNSRKLLRLIKHYSEQDGLEAWQQSKITKAADYLNSVLQAVSGQQTR